MSATSNETNLSTMDDNPKNDPRNFTRPWGINPISHLEEARHRSRANKFLTIKQSLTTMTHSSLNKEEQHDNVREITIISEHLQKMRGILLALDDSDIESATRFGKEIMIITNDLLSRVVNQIGQTNVRTPTLESVIAYIRGLIHMRSEHMRQTIPGSLLISWYELSHLMSAMQNEPELRMTNKKAKQLLNVAHDTAAWAYKHLTRRRSNDSSIGFVDRSSIPYTYE